MRLMVNAWFLAVLAGLVPVQPLSGQEQPEDQIVVAVADAFPSLNVTGPVHNIIALILRAPGEFDTILLNPTHATPVALRAAIETLDRDRTAMPTPARGMLLLVRMAEPRGPSPEMRDLARILQLVRQQESSEIGRIAHGKRSEFSPEELGIGR